MRAFVAISFPDEVVDALLDIQMALPVGRLVPAENLHLTLAFLGEEPVSVIETVHETLNKLSAPGFALELAGLGTFGNRHPANVHIAARKCEGLAGLHGKIRSLLHGAGLMLPRERFVPHVTLARFSRNMSPADVHRLGMFLASHADSNLGPFKVTQFSLIRSTLGAGAPSYDALAHYALR